MQPDTDLQLQAMIKSLREVVLPAVDPANRLAREQLEVSIGLLGLLASRLPLSFRYAVDELTRQLELARGLAALDGDDGAAPTDQLGAAIAHGGTVLARAGSGPEDLRAAVHALRAASAAWVGRLAVTGDAAQRAALTRLVLDDAREHLLRERAWLAPQGWEEAGSLPPLDSLV